MRVVVALSVLLLQAPQPVFRAGVTFVELDVTVLDGSRRPVTDLTASDFSVLEDGVPQKVESFQRVVLPAPAAPPATWWTSVPADVERNRAFENGNLLILVVDEASSALYRVKEIARRLVDGMRPEDRMAIIDMARSAGAQDFTDDRARLLQAIDRLSGAGFARLPAEDVGADNTMGGEMCGTVPFAEKALPFIRTLTEIARRTAHVQNRRKLLFLVSETVPSLAPGGACVEPWLEMYAEAQRAHLRIYPVNPRGLEAANDVTSTTVDEAARWRSLRRDQASAQRTLAENTGGTAITQTNLFAENLERALAENRAYYVIGYHSTNTSTDRTLRRISVSVARTDVTVRTRSGYVVPRPTDQRAASRLPPVVEALDAATRALIPATALPLDATALTFRTAQGPAIAVVAAPRPGADAPTDDQIQVRATLVDMFGEIRDKAERRVGARIGGGGANAGPRVPLFLQAPGVARYQVRVAANSAATNATGSVFLDVDVPDFARARLSLSSVAWHLASDSPGLRLAQTERVFPFLPSTRRTFRVDDQVETAARVYTNRLDAPVTITCQVSAGGAILDANEQVLRSNATGSAEGALVRCPVKVHLLPVGDFILEFHARAGAHSVSRKVRFSVVDNP